jgi:hypothetical protein
MTSPATAKTSVVNHEHYNSAAMQFEGTWPFGPNTYR